MGDLAVGSPMADPASKETRSFPSSAGLLAPESRSPVLLFFGSLNTSRVSSDLSSFETTCRMPESACKDKGLVDEENNGDEFINPMEKVARSAGSMLFPVQHGQTDRRTINVQVQLGHASEMECAFPSGSDGKRALCAYIQRSLPWPERCKC